MAFLPLTTGEVAPDQPVSTTLMDKIRTNFDDHEARLLAAAAGGSIGGILNGSFETANPSYPTWPKDWAVSNGTGGLVSLSTDSCHGKQSVKIDHTLTNGGGAYVETDYVAVSSCFLPPLEFCYKATAATLVVKVIARYFGADANGNPVNPELGTHQLYRNVTDNPGSWTPVNVFKVPLKYWTARYVKYQFVVGEANTGALGSAYFDGVGVTNSRGVFTYTPRIFTFGPGPYRIDSYSWVNLFSANILVPPGVKYLVLTGYRVQQYWSSDAAMRFLLPNLAATRYSTECRITFADDGYGGLVQVAGMTGLQDMVYDLDGLTIPAGGITTPIQIQKYSNQFNDYFDARSGAEYVSQGRIQANATNGTYTWYPPNTQFNEWYT